MSSSYSVLLILYCAEKYGSLSDMDFCLVSGKDVTVVCFRFLPSFVKSDLIKSDNSLEVILLLLYFQIILLIFIGS